MDMAVWIDPKSGGPTMRCDLIGRVGGRMLLLNAEMGATKEEMGCPEENSCLFTTLLVYLQAISPQPEDLGPTQSRKKAIKGEYLKRLKTSMLLARHKVRVEEKTRNNDRGKEFTRLAHALWRLAHEAHPRL
jgi:hypothetical protein